MSLLNKNFSPIKSQQKDFISQFKTHKKFLNILKFVLFHPLENGWDKVCDDTINSGTSHRDKHLRKNSFQIKSSGFSTMQNHRIFARHLIDEHRIFGKFIFDITNDIKIGNARLNHQHVSTFFNITTSCTNGQSSTSRRKLISWKINFIKYVRF